MFKRILVAIDGSRTSERAFAAALDLAVTHQAVVQPFYVVESGPAMYLGVPGYDPSILHTSLMEEGAKLAREAADAMKARGVAGEVVTVEANASDDVATLVIGSVAERCLRQATLPVLLIPAAASAPPGESNA
jgi:nucleotide-binding universal stress UspA family protein